MILKEVFERFVRSCPACVMYRMLLENIFSAEKVDAVFREAAEVQYERELLFSTLVDVVGQVVCRSSGSVHAAYLRQRDRITVSIRSLYGKLNHVEPETSRALVKHTATQIRELIDRMKGTRKPLLKGYRGRILDGNHIGKTEHRLRVLRNTSAGPLPGQALAILDPEHMVIEDVICCEDGHAQERSLLHRIPVEARDLLIDDRNFCTLSFLFRIMLRKAYFITRQHGRMPWEPYEKPSFIGPSETGSVYEEKIAIRDPDTGKVKRIRRVTVRLKKPTRDGDWEIFILTNLPAKHSAIQVAELYRERWTLEQAFNELTVHLRCELNTLGYPKAALFSFCVAVCSYNLLAAIKGVLRGVHGKETIESALSNFHLTDEISTVYGGMMIALPPEEWQEFQTLSPAQLATQLRCIARDMDLTKYPKHPRGPTKPKPKCPNAQFKHVSTAKLLKDELSEKKRKRSEAKANSP